MYNAFLLNGSSRLKLHEADPGSAVKCTGTVKQAVNSIDSFTFSMFPDNPCYNSAAPLISLVELYKADTGKLVYKGRVLKPTHSMGNSGLPSRKYICESELGYLCDSIQPYQTSTAGTVDFFTKVLRIHNNTMPESKRIYLGQMLVTNNPSSYTWHYVTSWQAIKDFIKRHGGEIRLRYGDDGKRYLDYTSTIWASGSDSPIEMAVNMQSVSLSVDPTTTYSGVYAVGAKLSQDSAERLEFGEIIWNTSLRAKYGDVVACVTWDDVTLAANLRRKASEWLSAQTGELHQYSVSAVDLSAIDKDFDEFTVGTQYPIKNTLIGLDDVVRCISRTIDINDPTSTKLTFGDKYETLTAMQSSRAAALNEKIDTTAENITKTQESFVQAVVENQTALLRGAEGGYVYQKLDDNGHPTDTFYLNSPSIDTATKALRFNYMGMGFWDKTKSGQSNKTALTGDYADAWTIDGVFHTEFICGKEITGFTFNNGDGTFKVEADGTVTAKNLTITGGNINIETNSDSDDIIKLNFSNDFGSHTIILAPNRVDLISEDLLSMITSRARLTTGGIVVSSGQVSARVSPNEVQIKSDITNTEAVILSNEISVDGDIKAADNITAGGNTAYSSVKGSVFSNNLYWKDSDSTVSYHSIRTFYDTVMSYINSHP